MNHPPAQSQDNDPLALARASASGQVVRRVKLTTTDTNAHDLVTIPVPEGKTVAVRITALGNDQTTATNGGLRDNALASYTNVGGTVTANAAASAGTAISGAAPTLSYAIVAGVGFTIRLAAGNAESTKWNVVVVQTTAD